MISQYRHILNIQENTSSSFANHKMIQKSPQFLLCFCYGKHDEGDLGFKIKHSWADTSCVVFHASPLIAWRVRHLYCFLFHHNPSIWADHLSWWNTHSTSRILRICLPSTPFQLSNCRKNARKEHILGRTLPSCQPGALRTGCHHLLLNFGLVVHCVASWVRPGPQ